MRYNRTITEGRTICVEDGQPVLVKLAQVNVDDTTQGCVFLTQETPESLAEAMRSQMEAQISQMPEYLAKQFRERMEEEIGGPEGITAEALERNGVEEVHSPVPLGEPDLGDGVNFIYQMGMN